EDESVTEAPSGNGGKTEEGSGEGAETGGLSWNERSVTECLPLAYAECFSADHYGDDYTLLSVMDDERFLIAEEGAPVPSGLPDDITVLKKPFSRIYLASSSAMDFFLRLSAEDMISMTSTKAEDWSLPAAKELVEAGDILYVGKYNAPDYERLIERDCDLAIENTMIYHNPETKELIEKLEIPVLVERSSYEKHPLGRMEWIKVYGLLCGKEEEAGKFFSEATEKLDQMLSAGDPAAGSAERPKTAFFYITAGGLYNIRRPGDYITKMIGLAGGEYVFDTIVSEAGNASSSMNVTAEEFYERAREADILIYNSTVEGELFALSDLLAKDPLLADYKAVREGNVWCTEKNMFQEITGTADMIGDLALLMNGRAEDDLRFIHRLQ
nr:ABC transporter substrate-binding protein [Lachnospiraceae bacterium]